MKSVLGWLLLIVFATVVLRQAVHRTGFDHSPMIVLPPSAELSPREASLMSGLVEDILQSCREQETFHSERCPLRSQHPELPALQALVDKLTARLSKRERRWKVYLYENDYEYGANAVACPGNYLFLTTSVLDETKDDSARAVVIAHAIGHALANQACYPAVRNRSATRARLLRVTTIVYLRVRMHRSFSV